MGFENLSVDIPAKLKEIIGRESDRTGETLNEVVTRALAEQFHCPELAKAPRRKPGRPRKQISAA